MTPTPTVIRCLPLLLAGLVLMPAAQANADHFEDVCTRSDSGTSMNAVVYMPVQISLGSDVKEGEAYGPWFRHTITWTCTRTAKRAAGSTWQPEHDTFEVRTRYYPDAEMQHHELLAADPRFRIYTYGSSRFGFIFQITQHVDGQPPQTTPINKIAGGGGLTTEYFSDQAARKAGDITRFHSTLAVRLVKRKKMPHPTASLLAIVANVDSKSRYENGTTSWKKVSHYYNRLKITTHTTQAACQLSVPTSDVQLGTTTAHQLGKIGQTGPAAGFNLHFKNCPAYLGSVQYEFQPLSPAASFIASNGTLPQIGTSTGAARGVGVQVRDESNQPIPFNTPVELLTYDPHSPPPDYAVPLTARIIRTGDELTGGTVEAAMRVIATYK